MEFTPARPGSAGEHELQNRLGTAERANRFYSDQMLEYLNDRMQIFVGRQEMIFISTSDAHGECDCSFRAGPPGFVRVLDEKTISWPEYRGNGVLASAGNITENPHVGVLMIDFVKDVIGLHVNGRAEMVMDEDMRQSHPWLIEDDSGGRRPERWIVVHVEEAYVHCSKHIPRMVRVPMRRSVGTGDNRRELKRKGGDYFAARTSPSPWKEALDPDSEGPADVPQPAAAGAEPDGDPLAEPVGADYDTCGLDLPDAEPGRPAAQTSSDGAESEPTIPALAAAGGADDADGPIWGELTGRQGLPWAGRHEPARLRSDPLAAAAAAAEVSDGAADPTADERPSSLLPDEPGTVDDEQPGDLHDDPHAYVGSDAAATLLFGAGFDPFGSASRHGRREEPDHSQAGPQS